MSSLERETSSGLMYLQLRIFIKSGYNFLVKLYGVSLFKEILGIELILSWRFLIISSFKFVNDVPLGKTLLIYSWLTSIPCFS